MPDEIVIVNSSGERLPFKEAWLRGTILTIRNADGPVQPVIRAVREAIERSPDVPRGPDGGLVVTTDVMRHLMLEALEADHAALAVAETLRKRAALALDLPLPGDSPPPEIQEPEAIHHPALPGVGAGALVAGRQIAALAEVHAPRLAPVLRAAAEVGYMAANESLALHGPEMLAVAGELMKVPPQRLSLARALLLANCERARAMCAMPLLVDRYRDVFKDNWKKQDDETLDGYFRGFVENLLTAMSGAQDPTIYGEELEPGQKYVAVATTEREALLTEANRSFPSLCVRKSRKLAGPASALGGTIQPDERPHGIELTYTGRSRLALKARSVAEGRAIEERWPCDLKSDLPDDPASPGSDYVQEVEPGLHVYSYSWMLADETIDDDLLEKLKDLKENFADKLGDKAKDEVADFFESVGAQLAESLPVAGEAFAGGLGKAAGNLAEAGVKEGIEYILMLLQPTAYPSFRMSHLVIWPQPCRPLSMVVVLKGGTGGDVTPVPLASFDPARFAIDPPRARGGMEAFQVWFGASQPSQPCPRNAFFVMQQGRVLSAGIDKHTLKPVQRILIQGAQAPSVLQWRSPPEGFGAIVRQDETDTTSLTQAGSYLTALRADLRIVGTGWI